MARRRKSTPATPEARDLALAIRQGERRALTQKEIGAALGINERTVRKIKSGQTSGRKIVPRLIKAPKVRATENTFNAYFTLRDSAGNETPVSINIIVPDVRTRDGGRRAPTALDIFRLDMDSVADAEAARFANRYGYVDAKRSGPVRLRKIGTMRKAAAAIVRTGTML